MNDLGKKISAQRKKQGWTQAELGIKLNVTAQAVSKWENNASEPDIQTLLNMAKLFDITMDEFLNTQPVAEPELPAEPEPLPDESRADIIGFCVTCGRMLREGEAAETRPAILCYDCKAKAEEKARQEELRRQAEARRKEQADKAARESARIKKLHAAAERRRKLRLALIWSAVISILATVVFIAVDVNSFVWSGLHVLLYIAFAYFCYSFVAQLFFGSEFVYDCVIWGLTRTVRFPIFIFSLDLDGCVTFILVKVICGILSFIAGLLFAVLGTAFGMLCSGFAFPFALAAKRREVYDVDNESESIFS